MDDGLRRCLPPASVDVRGAATLESYWRFILDKHPHVLLVGPPERSESVLTWLRPHLRSPARECDCTTRLTLPPEAGSVILRDISSLDAGQQQTLKKWLDRNAGKQVVSMSCSSLFPFVERGSFLDTLYYRLNIVTLLLESSTGTEASES
jgi:sigma-54-interacting transcriptional regulator